VIVTHDLTTLVTVCERIAVLVDGKLTIGSVAELMRSRNPWIRDFLHGPRGRGAMATRRGRDGNG
jgi:phospholipid/cholesterol/gamma-HCH transport system ATP-binding protein